MRNKGQMKGTDQELTTGGKLEEVGRKILAAARNELYLKMRFLDVALGSLVFVMDAGTDLGQTGCISIMILSISEDCTGRTG